MNGRKLNGGHDYSGGMRMRELGGKKTVKLLTVHGTFAQDKQGVEKSKQIVGVRRWVRRSLGFSDPADFVGVDHGLKWWQIGSPFLTELQNYVEETLDVEPFHWSGKNSEQDRRQAGRRLAQLIRRMKTSPVVIGHSHGGSICIHAAINLAARPGWARAFLKGVTTIGTPMFLSQVSANPFARYNILGKLLLLLAIINGFVFVASLYQLFLAEAWDGKPAEGHSVSVLGVPLPQQLLTSAGIGSLIAVVLLWYGLLNSRRQRMLRRNSLASELSRKGVQIAHPHDEAIASLSQGTRIRPEFLSYKELRLTVFGALSFVLIILVGLIEGISSLLYASGIGLDRTQCSGWWVWRSCETTPLITIPGYRFFFGNTSAVEAFSELSSTIRYTAGLFIYVLFPAWLVSVVAGLAAPMVSAFIHATIKRHAFGYDVYGEEVKSVLPGFDASRTVGGIPPAVEEEINELSAGDAGAALARIRRLIAGDLAPGSAGIDPLNAVMQFERAELYHNAYFCSPKFTKFLAACFIDRFGLTPSNHFKADPEACEFLAGLGDQAKPAAALATVGLMQKRAVTMIG